MSYYNARWYDAKLGRFLSADSIVPGAGNPQSFNRYAYVLNNPLKYVDPSGHFWWIAAGAAVGGLVAYGAQVYNNTQQGMGLGAALTTDIDGMAIVAGAVTGASAVAMAPMVVAMAADALVGAGLLTGSAGVFSAGMSAGRVADSMATVIYGVSTTQATSIESGYKTANNNVTWSQLGETEAGVLCGDQIVKFMEKMSTSWLMIFCRKVPRMLQFCQELMGMYSETR